MRDLGDRKQDSKIDFTFHTTNTSAVPTTLSGTPVVSVYKANNTTETVTGVTLTVDYDTRTGLNHCRVVMTDSFYETANDYEIVITAGTVSGVSVVGATIATFSIENRFQPPASAGGNSETGIWKWSTTTTEADPGSGRVRVNNTTYSLVTEVYISEITDNSFNAIDVIEALEVGDTITIGQENNGLNYVRLLVATVPADQTGWFKIIVTHIDSGANIGNNQNVGVRFGFQGVTVEEFWAALRSGNTVVGSFGETLGNLDGHVNQTGDSFVRIGVNGNSLSNIDLPNQTFDLTGNITGDLSGSVGSVTAMTTTNVIQISGSTLAADNHQLMFDGTGYVDDTAPSSRSQVDLIGASSGGSIPIEATSDNTGGPIEGVSFVGAQTGTFTNTEADDGVYHVIDDTANDIDIIYVFGLGGSRIGVEVTFNGFLNSANDAMSIQAFNFVGSVWETRKALPGQNGVVNIPLTFNLLSKHTGTGVDAGKVYIRFVADGAMTNPQLNVDELIVGAVSTNETIGYQRGAAVWIDSTASNTNTEPFVDGTADNPVSTITAARTLADALNLKEFHQVSGSTITLDANYDEWFFNGVGAKVILGGQSISGATFERQFIEGNGTGVKEALFRECQFVGASVLDFPALIACNIKARITINASGNDISIINCMNSSGTRQTIDFGVAVNSNHINMIVSGDFEIENMGQSGTDSMEYLGLGELVFNVNCVAGTAEVHGNPKITDNSSTITLVNRSGIEKLLQIQGSGFTESTDSLEAIRDRGDAAWITGGGGSIADILNIQPLIPPSIDLANTATFRLGLMLTNALDDLPTTAEITPGTISIDRKAIGGTTWSNVVSNAACSKLDGVVFFDEVFDTGTTYAEGDSIRITFKNQKITVATNDFEITSTTGQIFYSSIRQTERGTNNAATSTQLAGLITTVGVAGLGLSDLGGMSTTMKAQVKSEVFDVLGTDSNVDGFTAFESLRIVGSATAGKSSNAGSGVETYRSLDDTSDVMVATIDGSGNRTIMTLTP